MLQLKAFISWEVSYLNDNGFARRVLISNWSWIFVVLNNVCLVCYIENDLLCVLAYWCWRSNLFVVNFCCLCLLLILAAFCHRCIWIWITLVFFSQINRDESDAETFLDICERYSRLWYRQAVRQETDLEYLALFQLSHFVSFYFNFVIMKINSLTCVYRIVASHSFPSIQDSSAKIIHIWIVIFMSQCFSIDYDVFVYIKYRLWINWNSNIFVTMMNWSYLRRRLFGTMRSTWCIEKIFNSWNDVELL